MAIFAAFGVAALAAVLFCLARGIADLRAKRPIWGALGIMIGLVLGLVLTTPMQTHAVKVDVPLRDR